MVVVGVLLAVLGLGTLIFGQIRYTETEPVVKAGPIQIDKKESHVISLPTVGGVVLLIAGLGFVFVGMRRN
jgi:UDP-N-acetylmuramyl pentapeptide phosphotransferase/UDP-N-acetylglucosamine-1-phosphate transferase